MGPLLIILFPLLRVQFAVFYGMAHNAFNMFLSDFANVAGIGPIQPARSWTAPSQSSGTPISTSSPVYSSPGLTPGGVSYTQTAYRGSPGSGGILSNVGAALSGAASTVGSYARGAASAVSSAARSVPSWWAPSGWFHPHHIREANSEYAAGRLTGDDWWKLVSDYYTGPMLPGPFPLHGADGALLARVPWVGARFARYPWMAVNSVNRWTRNQERAAAAMPRNRDAARRLYYAGQDVGLLRMKKAANRARRRRLNRARASKKRKGASNFKY